MSAGSKDSQERLGPAAGMVKRALTLALECIENAEDRHPTPGLLIVGRPSCGKTTVARELQRLYPATETAQGSYLPVLFVETPAYPTVRKLAGTFLLGLGVDVHPRHTTQQLTGLVLRWLKVRRVRVIVADEVHRIAEGKPTQVHGASDYFRALMTDAELPIVLLGRESAGQLIDVNDQLRRRFTSTVEFQPSRRWVGSSGGDQ
jgi:energy-coupling factor transporter ATP-binding protein EcfA2